MLQQQGTAEHKHGLLAALFSLVVHLIATLSCVASLIVDNVCMLGYSKA